MSTKFLNNCVKFRKLLAEGGLMLPGAYNGQVARLCALNGFQAMYLSGVAGTPPTIDATGR